jgi:hypothetical protein
MTPQRDHGNSPESRSRKRFFRWLTKHKAVVAVVSALTVLTSFVVKETLDEPAKDRLSAIQGAIRDNNEEQVGLYTQLTDINSNLLVLRDKVMEGKQMDDVESQRMRLSTENTKVLELLGQNMAHLVVLREVLSSSFKGKKAAFDEKYRTVQSVEKTDSVEALAKSVRDWQTLYDESRILRGEGVKELMELQERTEARHRWYTWITYISLGLGWVVGLTSSLAGGKGVSAGE